VPPFQRILVANRGEIALRVIRACRELGIQTVAVYSKADEHALYLRYADETICIGPSASTESYLSIPNIIAAAEIANVDAIHPGYGFLSENAHFAEVCRASRIEFIGPDTEAIVLVGDKARARQTAQKAGILVVPGSDGTIQNEEDALGIAQGIGYPVLLKASAGGGGRGMRVAHNDISLVTGFRAARSEAEAAFGDGAIYLEKYLQNPRHVEIQILGDRRGNIVHLGERDCSLQRRHQKLVEEAPSPAVTRDLRKRMGKAAVRLAKAAGFTNAGTVEFLLDPSDGKFYFIEVNARIQVEHPLSEAVTGIDLIREQIRLASGEKLGYGQDAVRIRGAAIECRINAEDPDNDFKPRPGTIGTYITPGGPGVRVDSHVYPGYKVPSAYDSLIGKLIVHRRTREEAVVTMRRALDEFIVDGIPTTIPFHRRVMRHPDFLAGTYDTGFIESSQIAGGR
jgi:acetyl-CoA carboxylase, biotin carboxylase subunit